MAQSILGIYTKTASIKTRKSNQDLSITNKLTSKVLWLHLLSEGGTEKDQSGGDSDNQQWKINLSKRDEESQCYLSNDKNYKTKTHISHGTSLVEGCVLR